MFDSRQFAFGTSSPAKMGEAGLKAAPPGVGGEGVYFWSVSLKWQKRSQRGKICSGQELRGSMGTRGEAMQAAQVSRRTSAVLGEGSL